MAKKVKKKAAKKRQPRKTGKSRKITRERITVPSRPILVAVRNMLDVVRDVRTRIERLPLERQKVEPNKSSLARAIRSVGQLEAMQLLVDAAVCCDVQIQNCEFEIEP